MERLCILNLLGPSATPGRGKWSFTGEAGSQAAERLLPERVLCYPGRQT